MTMVSSDLSLTYLVNVKYDYFDRVRVMVFNSTFHNISIFILKINHMMTEMVFGLTTFKTVFDSPVLHPR